MECQALKRVREEFGLTNVIPMIPFCRTPEEGAKVIEVMAESGLDRAKDASLKIYVMCEIPANILRADDFLQEFDGMSIGSNDLAQLTLAAEVFHAHGFPLFKICSGCDILLERRFNGL